MRRVAVALRTVSRVVVLLRQELLQEPLQNPVWQDFPLTLPQEQVDVTLRV